MKEISWSQWEIGQSTFVTWQHMFRIGMGQYAIYPTVYIQDKKIDVPRNSFVTLMNCEVI
jgi:hypothetical protein